MPDIINKHIVPAVSSYINELCSTASAKCEILSYESCLLEKELAGELSEKNVALHKKSCDISSQLTTLNKLDDMMSKAKYIRDTLVPTMEEARKIADSMESRVSEKYWPFPTYSDLLFSV